MKLRIWGARGSIPAPLLTADYQKHLKEVLTHSRGIDLNDPGALDHFIERLPPHLRMLSSSNTTCFEIRANDALFILDMGSGIRLLGRALMQHGFGEGEGQANILMSHTHWDHLEGFPFFVPAYIPGNKFHFYTPFDDMEWRLRQLMRPPFFPVDLDYPQASRYFNRLIPGQVHEIDGVQVELIEMNHPGKSYTYKLTYNNKRIVFATDAEYHSLDHESTALYEAFYRNADVLIFDAMYTFEDAVTSKVDWGHSTAKFGAELARRAGVK